MNELRIPDPFDTDLLPGSWRSLWRPWRLDADDGTPQIRLDVSEDDKTYAVKADIPGVRKEDIDVRIDGNVVTIAAEIKKDKEEKKDGRVLRSERRCGWTSRSFTLASAVDSAAADAKYANGVLELKLPKKTSSEGKRLAVG